MKLTDLLALALCAAVLSWPAATVSADEDRPLPKTDRKEGDREKKPDAPREGQDKPREGRDAPREGQDRPREGGDAPREGQDRPREGRDAPREGQDRPREGRDAPREGQAGRLPEGLIGFNGNVRVVVVEKGREANAALKVMAVNKVYEEANKARAPRELVGRVIEIRPIPGRDGAGAAQQRELQAAFIQRLRPKLEGDLNLRHAEGNVFFITELTQEQRAFAAGQFEGERGERREQRPEGREDRPAQPERRDRD